MLYKFLVLVTYKVHVQSNLSLQTPLYYGQFIWSQKCQKSYFSYLYNTDTSVKLTLGSVPLVSVLKRFDCIRCMEDNVKNNASSVERIDIIEQYKY